VAAQFFQPAASAATPVVVGSAHLGQANSLLSYVNSIVGIVGPVAGALLFTSWGPQRTVAVVCALYLCAAPLLSGVPAGRAPTLDMATTALAAQVAEGVRYIWHTPILRYLVGNAFVFCLGYGSLNVLNVVFVTRALHQPQGLVSALYVATGAGALGGSTLMTICSSWARGRYHLIISWGMVANAGAVLLYAVAPTLPAALAAVGLAGFVYTLTVISYITLMQLRTPDSLMGRVMSVLYMTIATGMIVSLSLYIGTSV
jgi:hypothetical protein